MAEIGTSGIEPSVSATGCSVSEFVSFNFVDLIASVIWQKTMKLFNT